MESSFAEIDAITTPQTLSFEDYVIELVEPHRVLYDPGHPDYRKNDVKNQVWNSIRDTMNIDEMTVDHIKKKWKSIVNAYRNSKKKPPSGSGAGRKKRYRHDLSFLDPYQISEEPSGRVSSIQFDSDDGTLGDNLEVVDGGEIQSSEDTIQSQPTPTTSRASSRQSLRSNQVELENSKIDQLLDTVGKTWESFSKDLELTDSVSLFCDSLKDKLRSMDSIKLTLCQADILTVIARHMAP